MFKFHNVSSEGTQSHVDYACAECAHLLLPTFTCPVCICPVLYHETNYFWQILFICSSLNHNHNHSNLNRMFLSMLLFSIAIVYSLLYISSSWPPSLLCSVARWDHFNLHMHLLKMYFWVTGYSKQIYWPVWFLADFHYTEGEHLLMCFESWIEKRQKGNGPSHDVWS